jgi:hypothetical protein
VTIRSKSEGEVGTRRRERRGITVLMVKAKNREHIKKIRQKRGADLLRRVPLTGTTSVCVYVQKANDVTTVWLKLEEEGE